MAAPLGLVAAAQHRIARLASLTPVHRALYWLHLHEQQVLAWQLAMTRIPAPPFAEAERAAWFLERFREIGLEDVHLDEVGNAMGELSPASRDGEALEAPRCIVVSAHLDTVFPPGTDCDPRLEGSRYIGPGITDNAAGLSALLAIAAALRFSSIVPPVPILFAANVGEEGEGDLRGMRHLCSSGRYAGRIAAVLALEGSGSTTLVHRALGSLRLRVTISGPGGHSWADAGAPNPIFLMSEALAACARLPLPSEPRTVLNAGLVSGGTSVNSIPSSATVLLDVRSTDPGEIEAVYAKVQQCFHGSIESFRQNNLSRPAPQLRIEIIGRRPAAELPADAPLLHSVRAVDRHLGLRTEMRIGSTDANIPLSLGISGVALGAGGSGGGVHTEAEWFDPRGREIALRRILLTLLDTMQTVADDLPDDRS